MPVNKKLVAYTFIIMAAGAYRILVLKSGGLLTRVLIGGYLLALVMGIAVDVIGGPVEQLASAILLVAVVASVLSVGYDAITRIGTKFGG